MLYLELSSETANMFLNCYVNFYLRVSQSRIQATSAYPGYYNIGGFTGGCSGIFWKKKQTRGSGK